MVVQVACMASLGERLVLGAFAAVIRFNSSPSAGHQLAGRAGGLCGVAGGEPAALHACAP